MLASFPLIFWRLWRLEWIQRPGGVFPALAMEAPWAPGMSRNLKARKGHKDADDESETQEARKQAYVRKQVSMCKRASTQSNLKSTSENANKSAGPSARAHTGCMVGGELVKVKGHRYVFGMVPRFRTLGLSADVRREQNESEQRAEERVRSHPVPIPFPFPSVCSPCM